MTRKRSEYDTKAYKDARHKLLRDEPLCHWCQKNKATEADHLVEHDAGGLAARVAAERADLQAEAGLLQGLDGRGGLARRDRPPRVLRQAPGAHGQRRRQRRVGIRGGGGGGDAREQTEPHTCGLSPSDVWCLLYQGMSSQITETSPTLKLFEETPDGRAPEKVVNPRGRGFAAG